MNSSQEMAAGIILGILAILWLLPDSQKRAPKFFRLWQAATTGADPGQTPVQGPTTHICTQLVNGVPVAVDCNTTHPLGIPQSLNPNLSPAPIV